MLVQLALEQNIWLHEQLHYFENNYSHATENCSLISSATILVTQHWLTVIIHHFDFSVC